MPCRASSASSAGATPPDIESPGLGDALAGLQLGRTFRGLGRDDGRTITRVLPMAVADFVAESFDDRRHPGRDRLARRPVHRDGSVVGRDRPRSCSAMPPATTAARPARRSSRAAARARWRRRSRRAAREAGVEIRTGAEVVAITSRDGRATGVVLASRRGDRPRGRRGRHRPEADPHAPGRPGRASARACCWRAGNIRTPGTVAKVNLALAGLPVFPAARRRHAAASRPDPRRARASMPWNGRFDAAKYGRLPDAADPRGDHPVAGRPIAGRRRDARHPRHERHRPVRAVRAARIRRVG